MPKKKLSFTLPLQVYPFDIRFSFGETDSQVQKYFKKTTVKKSEFKHIEFENNISNARCVMFEGGQALIRLRKFPADAGDFGHLQHEITHYVMFLLFSTIHMRHNLKTTEAYAYLTQYITTEVYNELWK